MSDAQMNNIGRYGAIYETARAPEKQDRRAMIPYEREERTRASGWPDNLLTLPRRYAISLEDVCFQRGGDDLPRAPRNMGDLITKIRTGRDKSGRAEMTLDFIGRMFVELMKFDGEWDSDHESNRPENVEDNVPGQWYIDIAHHWPHLVDKVMWFDETKVLAGAKYTDDHRAAHVKSLREREKVADARAFMNEQRDRIWAEVQADYTQVQKSEPEQTLEEELAEKGVADLESWRRLLPETRKDIIKRHGIKGNIGNATKVLIARFGWDSPKPALAGKAMAGGEA